MADGPYPVHYDASLVLKAAGLIASSAAVATIVDLGAGRHKGEVIIDVDALEIASNDEQYRVVLQGSPDADFGTDANIVDLCELHLGASETKLTDSDKDDVVGQYVLPFVNWRVEEEYRYVRLYTVVIGTIATGVNYNAWIKPTRN